VLLPLFASEGTVIDAMVVCPSSWGSPLLAGAQGHTLDNEPYLVIIHEVPSGLFRPSEPIEKRLLEMLHLQRLAVDAKFATGSELFEAWEVGSDPPDFSIFANGETSGWELTTLSIPSRRNAQALFREVRSRLLLQHRHRVGHLSGYQINMWFGHAEDKIGLPYERTDAASIDELVELLVAYRPDPNQFRVEVAGGPPQQLTNANPVAGPQDVKFFCVPLLGGVPSSWLLFMTGFELGLSYQSNHRISDEWSRLQELISRKDRPGNDVLLISAGAPDRLGQVFLAEEALANFLVAHPQPIVTNYLQRVVLHIWGTGAAFDLIGDVPSVLWPALYQGITPLHQQFVQSPSR
jgi:hypothetical protein